MTEHVDAAETVASLDDLAGPGPEMVSVAARLVDEVGHVFGIPEMGQVTRDGGVRISYRRPQSRPWVQAWPISTALP